VAVQARLRSSNGLSSWGPLYGFWYLLSVLMSRHGIHRIHQLDTSKVGQQVAKQVITIPVPSHRDRVNTLLEPEIRGRLTRAHRAISIRLRDRPQVLRTSDQSLRWSQENLSSRSVSDRLQS